MKVTNVTDGSRRDFLLLPSIKLAHQTFSFYEKTRDKQLGKSISDIFKKDRTDGRKDDRMGLFCLTLNDDDLVDRVIFACFSVRSFFYLLGFPLELIWFQARLVRCRVGLARRLRATTWI